MQLQVLARYRPKVTRRTSLRVSELQKQPMWDIEILASEARSVEFQRESAYTSYITRITRTYSALIARMSLLYMSTICQTISA